MPDITIIIPTYRPGDYIFDCLASIKAQTFPHGRFETIIVLNGCDAPYRDSLRRFISGEMEGMDVSLQQTDRPGVSNARNIGLELACGEYVAFVDDDDRLDPDYLEQLHALAVPGRMVFSEIASFGPDPSKGFFLDGWLRKSLARSEFSDIPLYRLRSILSVPFGKLIPVDMIGRRRFDTRFANGEDALFITQLTDRLKSVACAPQTRYNVRIRPGSASRRRIPLREILSGSFGLWGAYAASFMRNPGGYDLRLFLCRFPGVMKNALSLFKNR